MSMRKSTLIAAGAGTVLVALVHVAALIVGPKAFVYLDAADLAVMMEQGSLLPVVLTLGVIAILLVFAAYAFVGAGLVGGLPRVSAVLAIAGGILAVRGLGVFWFVYLVLVDAPEAIPREIAFSLVALVLGALFLIGRRGHVTQPSDR